MPDDVGAVVMAKVSRVARAVKVGERRESALLRINKRIRSKIAGINGQKAGELSDATTDQSHAYGDTTAGTRQSTQQPHQTIRARASSGNLESSRRHAGQSRCRAWVAQTARTGDGSGLDQALRARGTQRARSTTRSRTQAGFFPLKARKKPQTRLNSSCTSLRACMDYIEPAGDCRISGARCAGWRV